MDASVAATASFVRGFFLDLNARGRANCVLHGGADGFERRLSDVDFVVGKDSFDELPKLISGYCERSGWRLCQILRHETTAAYFVCSAIGDPSQAVALDACSDYQRNGTPYLAAGELLDGRRALPWGGFEPSAAGLLQYRFAKAAAKGKPAAEAVAEFSTFDPEVRDETAAWLKKTWGINPASWNEADLAAALGELRSRSNLRPPLLRSGAWKRVAGRLLRPTGCVVVTEEVSFETSAARFEEVFSRLYFRRFAKTTGFRPAHLKDLVASALVVVPTLKGAMARIIPHDCLYRPNPHIPPVEQCEGFAKALAERCAERENLIES